MDNFKVGEKKLMSQEKGWFYQKLKSEFSGYGYTTPLIDIIKSTLYKIKETSEKIGDVAEAKEEYYQKLQYIATEEYLERKKR